jgi:hypothetical protein
MVSLMVKRSFGWISSYVYSALFFFLSFIVDQIFGVPLTELARHGTEHVPTFIKRLLDAIVQGNE